MINVKYVGRMGNNMFQYALGRILAENKNVRLNASPIEGFPNTFDSVNPDNMIETDPLLFKDHVLKINGNNVSVDDIINIENRAICLDGWFQRYEYYRDYKEDIRKWLEVEDLDVGQTENDIIIHLRMGDCITGSLAQDPYVMPVDYFNKSLESTSFDKLYVCSDPETLTHPLFQHYIDNFKDHNPIVLNGDTMGDFRAIKSFNKIIMSQSTFSWWGAFLSKANEVFIPVPMAGIHTNEWSLASENVAMFVDDESRYKYIKQYEDGWQLVNLQDIPER